MIKSMMPLALIMKFYCRKCKTVIDDDNVEVFLYPKLNDKPTVFDGQYTHVVIVGKNGNILLYQEHEVKPIRIVK